jgi:hypothetical protein
MIFTLRWRHCTESSQFKTTAPRVIYFLATVETIYLVLAYAKSEKESLTAAEKAELKKLTTLLKGEV